MLQDCKFPEYNQRCQGHDYYGPFIYHIILKKAKGCPSFGKVAGSVTIPYNNFGCAHIVRSSMGKACAGGLRQWNDTYPNILLWKYSIMPDHIHLIINKTERTKEHLTHFIKQLKYTIRNCYNAKTGSNLETNDIFELSYCDKPLFDDRSLDGWYRYIELNPHRLAMRIQRPDFFTRINNLVINGQNVQAYGNLFLLRNPDNYAVKISRSFTDKEKENLQRLWISESIKGSVLVSPFISQEEKEIFHFSDSLGGKFVLIQHEAFGPRYKPSGHLFELCETGRLLIISLSYGPKTSLSREICNRMNSLAEALCTRTNRSLGF